MKNLKDTAKTVQFMQKSVSLLQQFERYREENPEAVKQKEHKDDEKLYFEKSLPLDIVQKINTIHFNVESKEIEKRKIEEIKQQMPPTLNMHLKYYFPGQRSKEDCVDEDDIDVFDIQPKNMLAALVTDGSPQKSKSRLEITVEDAYNIDVWLGKGEKILESAVKCTVIPDSEKRGPKLKTDYCRVSFDYVRWDHKFVMQGFTIEQLLSRSFEFVLRIKTNKKTRDVGYCRLNPNKCEISNVKEEEREYCTFDTDFWMKFLQSPSVPIEVILPIIKAKKKANDEKGEVIVEDSSVFNAFKSIF